jgi:GalNAc-alpha-(1->4)-GalNAc-alpha-(1->3)-diNAcBac-PP-undecaprenol alpha-1,4-N-acetyl-D-galactosaminyltransferase
MVNSRGSSARRFRLTAVIGTLDAGGAERIMAVLTDAWAERGWDVTLLLTQVDEEHGVFFEPNPLVAVKHLDLYRVSRGPIDAARSNLHRIRVLRSAIRASRPDAVLAFITDTNVLAILAMLGEKTPVVVEEHIYSAWPPMPLPWRLLRLLTYPLAASVIGLTPSALATLGPARGRRGRVIPNPVMPPPPGETNPSAPPTMVAIGRLVPQKGYDILLPAFAQVATAHPDWRLEVWGEGPERPELERLRDALGLSDRVTFPGTTRQPYGVLRRASMFVMSSRREGFPTVLGEAMSCGLPVLSADCPSGPRELIRDGVDGLLVAPGDVQALAAGMERLMADPDLAWRLASRAPEVVERFSLSRVLERWDDVFAEVTGRPVGSTDKAPR